MALEVKSTMVKEVKLWRNSDFLKLWAGQTISVFGSQFTVSVVVNVNGDANSVQAVTVTASGPAGSSNPVSVSLR
jgi:hypothetical protein